MISLEEGERLLIAIRPMGVHPDSWVKEKMTILQSAGLVSQPVSAKQELIDYVKDRIRLGFTLQGDDVLRLTQAIDRAIEEKPPTEHLKFDAERAGEVIDKVFDGQPEALTDGAKFRALQWFDLRISQAPDGIPLQILKQGKRYVECIQEAKP